MRAPFQILAIPYKFVDSVPYYCVMHRSDFNQWQFVAGGGEENETPLEAAKREIWEESGITTENITELASLSYLPITIIKESCRQHWDKKMYVIPEYTFGFECRDDIKLSDEHLECVWLTYKDACDKLEWDSNRTALFELDCKLNEFLRTTETTNTKNIVNHYDLLIDENNDPVYDSEALKAYMDKWDGQSFIDNMELNESKSVLEIGVGTGRLAIRVAPYCRKFCGIDISPKTIKRAADNLSGFNNVTLLCNDFIKHNFFEKQFDVIYSSLTFMHISEKESAIKKVKELLTDYGIFVLSIDKNQSKFIDMGTYKVTVFPDTQETIKSCCEQAKLQIIKQYETEFANIFVIKNGL